VDSGGRNPIGNRVLSASVSDAPDFPSDFLDEAIRFFNEKEYYACHDVLEEEWVGTRGPRREALKALTMIAAGMHHLQTSEFRGAVSLLTRGLEILDGVPEEQHLLDPGGFREPVRSAAAKAARILRGESVEFSPSDLPAFRRPRASSGGK